MADRQLSRARVESRLRRGFETEAQRLVDAERARTPTERLLRIHLLNVISGRLGLVALADLAATISAASERQGGPRSPGTYDA